MSYLDQAIEEFVVESFDNLEQLERDMLVLELDPHSTEFIGRIFRTVHTLKGSCAFLGYSRLEVLAHTAENLLSLIRDGRKTFNQDVADALLKFVDTARAVIKTIRDERQEGDFDTTEIIASLVALQTLDLEAQTADIAVVVSAGVISTDVSSANMTSAGSSSPLDSSVEAKIAETVIPTKSDDAVEVIVPANPTNLAQKVGTAVHNSAVSENSVRVDVGILDKLMNLTGELVLTRNQIVRYTSLSSNERLKSTVSELNFVTGELQTRVMNTRMQPIGNIWGKFPRVVRDLALNLGKSVSLEMDGQDTELDKSLIEAIKDPLTHLIRNCVDHGIEKPALRRAKGKAEEGTVHLRAYQEGGQVVVEIEDNGGGIDTDKLLNKVIEKGLLTEASARSLSHHDALQLIFLPGLSTAETVTNVSGRGVGMDVVKSNIEKLGGSVDIQSELGKGTRMRLRIPLTLAIIPALLVSCCEQVFALPQLNVVELLRVDAKKGNGEIEYVLGSPVFRLRGRILPLVFLEQVLLLTENTAEMSPRFIVVVETDGFSFGVVVQKIMDMEEIVVKPLGRQLEAVGCFAGATILGDGSVCLIADISAVASRAGVKGHRPLISFSSEDTATGVIETMLVMTGQDGRRRAVPLEYVSRLEKIQVSEIEQTSAGMFLQYSGKLLPLIEIEQFAGGSGGVGLGLTREDKELSVVVTNCHEPYGLIVEEIVDIVEQQVELTVRGTSAGVKGVAIIDGSATDILDIAGIGARV
ncbi:MAG: chemotaxis protein CheA [bacterium]|nr:chemotaxis protein CheA [bacterium]